MSLKLLVGSCKCFFSFPATGKRYSHINDTDFPCWYHSNTERSRMPWRTALVSNCCSVMCVIHWDSISWNHDNANCTGWEDWPFKHHLRNSHPGAETGCVSIDSVRSTLSRTAHSVKRFILNVNPSSYYHALKGKQILKLLGFTFIACYYTKLHSLRGVSVTLPALSLVVTSSRIKSDTDACQKQLIFYYQCVIQ